MNCPTPRHYPHISSCLLLLANLFISRAISWSRTGTIASISPDGTALELRHLRAHPKDGSWDLGEPVVCPTVQGTTSNPLVHLEWAATNSPELAIFDSVGRVIIVSFAIALNNPFVMRPWDPDPVDNLNAISGCYWLPVAPPQPQVRAL
jgi:mediator of RNA polymerase II transcription subunit 16